MAPKLTSQCTHRLLLLIVAIAVCLWQPFVCQAQYSATDRELLINSFIATLPAEHRDVAQAHRSQMSAGLFFLSTQTFATRDEFQRFVMVDCSGIEDRFRFAMYSESLRTMSMRSLSEGTVIFLKNMHSNEGAESNQYRNSALYMNLEKRYRLARDDQYAQRVIETAYLFAYKTAVYDGDASAAVDAADLWDELTTRYTQFTLITPDAESKTRLDAIFALHMAENWSEVTAFDEAVRAVVLQAQQDAGGPGDETGPITPKQKAEILARIALPEREASTLGEPPGATPSPTPSE